jgi:hypothetical protein
VELTLGGREAPNSNSNSNSNSKGKGRKNFEDDIDRFLESRLVVTSNGEAEADIEADDKVKFKFKFKLKFNGNGNVNVRIDKSSGEQLDGGHYAKKSRNGTEWKVDRVGKEDRRFRGKNRSSTLILDGHERLRR